MQHYQQGDNTKKEYCGPPDREPHKPLHAPGTAAPLWQPARVKGLWGQSLVFDFHNKKAYLALKIIWKVMFTFFARHIYHAFNKIKVNKTQPLLIYF